MKILVVDDSKVMRMIIMRTLRQAGFGAHAISEAGSGTEALAVLRNERFDLVLCDWNMPEMTGLELVAVIRTERLAPRVGFVTSEGTSRLREATEAGALFLIPKPFTVESFEQTLRTVLVA